MLCDRDFISFKAAIVKTVNDVLSYNGRSELSAKVHLDFSAAFHTVDNDISLSRLETGVDVKGTTVSWFVLPFRS